LEKRLSPSDAIEEISWIELQHLRTGVQTNGAQGFLSISVSLAVWKSKLQSKTTAKSLPNTIQHRTELCYNITSQQLSCKLRHDYVSSFFIHQETFGGVLASTR